MSKLETPMIVEYWNRVGGTLIEEFQMVQGDSLSGPRRSDAVIVVDGKKERIPDGKRVVN